MTESIKLVAAGCTTRLRMADGSERTITINHGDSDPEHNIISTETPLARAIMGAKPGESRSYSVMDRKFVVEVLEVS